MDPDGDYESRHSIRSTPSDNGNPIDDVTSPSKIFAPDDDTKLPAKPTKDGDAYDGPTAPPMEVAPSPVVPSAAATAYSSHRSAMKPRSTAYEDMMSGKLDLASEVAPISNSVAVPIDSEDMALPEAKALPIVSSAANEGTKVPPATLEEVDVEEETEAQIDEEDPTPIPVPSSSNGVQSSATSDETSDEGDTDTEDKVSPTRKRCTRKRKLCFVAFAFVTLLGTVLGVLFGTDQGQLLIKYPNCHVNNPHWIGDGHCDSAVFTTEYNTAECGWDGGDCFVDGYPDCHVNQFHYIGDGECKGMPPYNTADCGWDGGDCLFAKKYDKACRGTIGSTWKVKTRAWCQYKCVDEGADCKAYDYNSDTDNCRIFSSYSAMWHSENQNCWVKRNSTLAAEDIIEKLSECISGNPATGGINQRCVGGVLSTLRQDTIDKLTPCAGLVVNEWEACIIGQFIN